MKNLKIWKFFGAIFHKSNELLEDFNQPKAFIPKKNLVTILDKHLKEYRNVKKIKIEAISDIHEHLTALKHNLKNMKQLTEISIKLHQAILNKNDILSLVRIIKSVKALKFLSINLHVCYAHDNNYALLLRSISKLQKLESLKIYFASCLGLSQTSFTMISNIPSVMNNIEQLFLYLQNINIEDNNIELLQYNLLNNKKIKDHTIALEACPRISFVTKLKMSQKKGFYVFSCPSALYTYA